MAEIERWMNTGAGTIYLTRYSADGTKKSEPVPGNREFRISAEDRRTHSNACASPAQDPFNNGQFLPLDAPASASAAPERTSPANVAITVKEGTSAAELAGVLGAALGAPPADGTPVTLEAVRHDVALLRQHLDTVEARLGGLEAVLVRLELEADDDDDEVPPLAVETPPYVDPPEVDHVAEARARDAEPASDEAQREAGNPNHLSPEDFATVITGHHKTAGALLARIDSEVLLGNLLARARAEGSPARQKAINDRLHEVNPEAIGLAGTNRPVDDAAVDMQATTEDLDKLHDSDDVDMSAPPMASAMAPGIPPPAPLPSDLASAFPIDR